MSSLIERLNLIKTACTLDWLTPSQMQTLERIKRYLAIGEVTNLYGPQGSGKTFIAWVLVKQGKATYLPNLETFMTGTTSDLNIPIIDNLPSTRNAYRTLLKHLNFRKQKQAIAITQVAVPDDCYRVFLNIQKSDMEYICQRLQTIEPDICLRDGGNLHHLINPDLPVLHSGVYND